MRRQAAIKKNYNDDGMRMTDCCGCMSTFDEYGQLYCKGCYQPVNFGEGDGSEYKRPTLKEIACVHKWNKSYKRGEARVCTECGGKQTN